MAKSVNYTASVIFALIAILHLWRAIADIQASIGLWQIPIWFSWIAFAVAGFLAVWLWMTAD